ncbi:MAG: hypothetical protein JNM00_02715, partial [Flavobacteriales bacterium]|nr:hypothetical protein [Flavobacteriales bacterium]
MITEYILPAGIKYVTLYPTCLGRDAFDTQIACEYEPIAGKTGPSVEDKELINTIQYLHSVGLRVILKPHFLLISKIEDNFSGPELGYQWGDETWRAWFENYTAFITHYAQIAEDHQVDIFVIGNEMEYSTHREEDWRQVIASVRSVYSGPITYAANTWDFEALNVKFWDDLDFISTNAYNYFYQPINDVSIEGMRAAWEPALQQLEALSEQYGKPVLFTEFGASSKEGQTRGIARDWIAAPYDGQAQADYYTAFFKAIQDRPWVKGVILWDVDTQPLQGGPNDLAYTFIAKPAEAIVRQYFGGVPVTSTPIPQFVEVPADSMVVYDDELSFGWRPWFEEDATTFPDFQNPDAYSGQFSIRVAYSEYIGLWLVYDPYLKLSKYKWLEFQIKVGNPEPKHLFAVFEDWTTGMNIGSRMALVNDARYIEGGGYQPGVWQRVRIPLIDLGLTDQYSTGFNILGCAWPCDQD